MNLFDFELAASEREILGRAYFARRASRGNGKARERFVLLRDLPNGRTIYAVVGVRGRSYARGRSFECRVTVVTYCDRQPCDVSYAGSIAYHQCAGWVTHFDWPRKLSPLTDDWEAALTTTDLASGHVVNLATSRYAHLEHVYDCTDCKNLLAFLRRYTASEEAAALVRAGFYDFATPRGISRLRKRPAMRRWLRSNSTWLRRNPLNQLDLCWMYDNAADRPVTAAYAARLDYLAARRRNNMSQKQRDTSARMAARLKKYAGLCAFVRDGYTVALPQSVDDLVTEGQLMHNCVGGYGSRIANGVCIVAFVRRAGRHFCDIEFNADGGIVQCREACNREARPELWAIARDLGGQIRTLGKRRRARNER